MSCYLALDTATEACSAAISVDGQVRELFEPMQREHTQRALPMLQELLAQAGRSLSQVDGLVCGISPGSFAGLRIGVGVIKGIALARGLPVVGVSSLAMLAQRAMREDNVQRVVPVIDARMSEVYVGAYRRGPSGLAEALRPDRVCSAADAPALPEGMWQAAGSGWARYEPELRAALRAQITAIDAAALPHAHEALVLAAPEFSSGRVLSGDELAPAYLRDRVALTLDEQETLRQKNRSERK